ncbi:MAG TPA: hypothetical protein VIE46_00400, partial [Gemmatimonadales bacterium]
AITRRNVSVVVRCLAACGVVAVVHVFLAGLGYWRLLLDGLLYFALVIAVGALRPREILGMISKAMKRPAQPGV